MKVFLLLALLTAILYGLGSSLVPLLVATIAALLSEPYIVWLKTKGIRKPYSTVLIIVGIFLPIIILNAILLPSFLRETKEFLTVLPDNMTKMLDQIEGWAVRIGVSLDYSRKDVLELVKTHSDELSVSVVKMLTDTLKKSAGNITQIIITILNIFLIPIFFFYLVSEENYWRASLKTFIPNKYHARLTHTLEKSIVILKHYLQGQALACLTLAFMYAIGLQLAGLRFGILIGLTTGLLTFIPYVGFSIGMMLGLVVALSMGKGIGFVALILGVFMTGQALETFVVTPKFVGKNVGLTALESILILIIFGNLFGFAGMLVAIPTGAVIKTAITEYAVDV